MNTFKFHSVGQGLFYTGSIADGGLNFVYDCGTESSQEFINKAVADYTSQVKNVDFVLISHLHWDHFSGLYSLFRQCTVNKIYLPYLGRNPQVIRFLLIYELFVRHTEGVFLDETELNERVRLFDLLSMLYQKGLRENWEIPHRVEYEKRRWVIEHTEVVFVGPWSDGAGSIFESFSVDGYNKYWEFVFINKSVPELCLNLLNAKIMAEMKKRGVQNVEALFFELNDPKMNTFTEIYKSVFGKGNSLNLTSTFLFHYPLFPAKISCCNSSRLVRCSNHDWNAEKGDGIETVTCLSGDAMFDSDILEKWRKVRTNMNPDLFLGVLQVPHHGAILNWNRVKKYGILAKYNVISFGLGNRYRHPNSEVIDEIVSTSTLSLVDQYAHFSYQISEISRSINEEEPRYNLGRRIVWPNFSESQKPQSPS